MQATQAMGADQGDTGFLADSMHFANEVAGQAAFSVGASAKEIIFGITTGS